MQLCGAAERSAPDTTTDAQPNSATTRLLERVQLPAHRASVVLASGRRIEVEAADADDHLVVHGRDGRILLEVELTDSGPRLRFEGADVELRAARSISIGAQEVAIEASRMLTLSSRGDLCAEVDGDHHTRVRGDERLEAKSVEIQASEANVALRAMRRIALDGERIALNDDPCPQPFAWSKVADDGSEDG
jgi:hypothetical protein